MYLKNCCALLLLALIACQAAPPKVVEKKSIGEEASKLEKDNLKLEEPGAEKERAKKSATTFCVQVHSNGVKQEVPCKLDKTEFHPLVLNNQPAELSSSKLVSFTPVKETFKSFAIMQQPQALAPQPIQLIQTQPTAPAPQPMQPVQVIQTQPTAPAPQPMQPVQLVQTQPMVPAPQPLQLVQSQPTAPAPQPVQLVQTQPMAPVPQPIQLIQAQPVAPAPQPVQLIQAQPQPQVKPLNMIQSEQPVPMPIKIETVPQPVPQVVLPTAQSAQEPMHFYFPQPSPNAQVPPTTINIVPAAPSCQQQAYQPQPSVTIVKPEVKSETVEIIEKSKMEQKPEQKLQEMQSDSVEILSAEPPCKQQVLVMPPRPMVLLSEQKPLQLSTQTYCNQPHHLFADCNCPMHKLKSSVLSRHHAKLYDNNMMMVPSAFVSPVRASMIAQPSYPSNSFITGARQSLEAERSYDDAVTTMHTEATYPFYPENYGSMYSGRFAVHPDEIYDPYPYRIVNAYPRSAKSLYRESQLMQQQNLQKPSSSAQTPTTYSTAPEVANASKEPSSQKQEAKDNQPNALGEISSTTSAK